MSLKKTILLSMYLISGSVNSSEVSLNAIQGLSKINIDPTAQNLLQYSGAGDLNTVKLLVQSGVDINSKLGFYGGSAIHNASSQGHLSLVKWFINQGVEVDVIDNFGSTPLIWASYYGRNNIVEYLLSHGANPNIMTKKGPTALVAAIQSKSVPTIKALINKGADIHLKSPDGLSPVKAAEYLNEDKITKLIEQK